MRAFPEAVKREVAREWFEAAPGKTVDVECRWCATPGRLHWYSTDQVVGRIQLEGMEWDHHKPVCLGGKSTLDNCHIVCKPCNREKAGKHPYEFWRARFPDLAARYPDVAIRFL